MKKLLTSLLLTFFCTALFSQEFEYQRHKFQLQQHATVNLADTKNLPDWNARVTHVQMPTPGGSDYRSFLLGQKAIQREKYPLKRVENNAGQRSNVEAPQTGRMFSGNEPGVSVPNDNNMAISNDGHLISVINSTIYIYDLNTDSLLYDAGFFNFSFPNFGQGNFYDPKIIYDPEADRFFFTFLKASTPALSRICIAVSSPGDPTGEWLFYSLPGNPFDNNRWTDYPAISQNASDFFITANFIIPGEPWQTGFDGSMIWQIDKASVYSGDIDMEVELYTDFTWGNTLIRNLNPVDGAAFFDQNNMYLLSNRNFALENDTIFLLEVTNSVASGMAEVTISALESENAYFLAPSARQAEGHTFDTNDSRVLGAVLFDNSIQFVQNCLDTLSGVTGVYHGIINNLNGTPSVSGKIISFPAEDLDIGYPNISHIGTPGMDENTLISFSHTGPETFAGNSCVLYDNQQDDYSERLILKSGDNYVDILTGIYERWGDYTGSQPVYNTPGNVWISGSYGTSLQRNGTWVAELSTSGQFVGIAPEDEGQSQSVGMLSFPNPAQEMISVEIEIAETRLSDISLFDLNGRKIAELYSGQLKKGTNLLSFDLSSLASGTYLIRVQGEDQSVVTEKIIKK